MEKNKRVGATQPKKKRLHKFSGAWGEIVVGLARFLWTGSLANPRFTHHDFRAICHFWSKPLGEVAHSGSQVHVGLLIQKHPPASENGHHIHSSVYQSVNAGLVYISDGSEGNGLKRQAQILEKNFISISNSYHVNLRY